MRADVTSAYRLSAGHDASPVKLVIILYEQLIKDLRRASEAMARNDVEGRSREIDHALIVLARLQGTLDEVKGADVSRNLNRFYTLLRASLMAASVRHSPEMLNKQIKNLVQLREAWVEVEHVEARRVEADRLRIANTRDNTASHHPDAEQAPGALPTGDPSQARSVHWSG